MSDPDMHATLTGKGYVQYNLLRQNLMPTPMQMQRMKVTVDHKPCCAGVTAGIGHILQRCRIVKPMRMEKHNIVCRALALALGRSGSTVLVEPHVDTGDRITVHDLVVFKPGELGLVVEVAGYWGETVAFCDLGDEAHQIRLP